MIRRPTASAISARKAISGFAPPAVKIVRASCKNSKANCDAYSNIKNKNNELSNIQFIKLQDSIQNLNNYIKFIEKDNNILNSILSQKEFNENKN